MDASKNNAAQRTRPSGQLIGHALILVCLGSLASIIPSLVLYALTTFLFAFSGGQYRMVPVVNGGAVAPWFVALLIGEAALIQTRALPRAARVMALAYGACWLLAILVEWLVSFSLGGR